ncbi:leukocidin family pore-forming toxin [Veronia nyctiphanis]|nr:leukocidin family pore-forming toxin [Veronia nyctiphanis]
MKIVLSSFVAAALSSSSVYGTTQFGNDSFLGKRLITDSNSVYVNSEQVNSSDIRLIRDKLSKGYTLVIDNSDAYNADSAKENTRNILGVGFASPFVLARMVNGQLDFETINVEGDDSTPYNNILSSAATKKTISAAVNEASKEKSRDSTYQFAKSLTRNSASGPIVGLPEGQSETNSYTFTVKAKKYNIRCITPSLEYNWWKGHHEFRGPGEDVCGGKANSNIRYTVDLVRSEGVNGISGVAENKKYVRVSVLPESGGTGIHLTNTLHEKTVNVSQTLLSPFADNYSFSVGTNDIDIELIGHTPSQANPDTTRSETNGFTVGVSLSAGANGSGGSSGGSGGGDVSASVNYSYTHQRTITVVTNEYTLENQSGYKPERAAWTWNRKYGLNKCDWLKRRDHGVMCKFTGGFWEKGAFNLKMFSAISHKNFVPGFSASFEASPDKEGISTFDIEGSVGVMSLLATSYYPLLRVTKITDEHVTNVALNTSFDIDWNKGVFSDETVTD